MEEEVEEDVEEDEEEDVEEDVVEEDVEEGEDLVTEEDRVAQEIKSQTETESASTPTCRRTSMYTIPPQFKLHTPLPHTSRNQNSSSMWCM